MLKIEYYCEAYDEYPEKTVNLVFNEGLTWGELVCSFIAQLNSFGYIIDNKYIEQMIAAVSEVEENKNFNMMGKYSFDFE